MTWGRLATVSRKRRGPLACALALLITSLALATAAFPAAARDLREVTISWEPGDGEAAEYRVWCGGSARNYYTVEAMPANARQVTFLVPAWKRVCFTVTALDDLGQESAWGMEVCQEAIP